MPPKTVYIAGPMRGHDNFNFPAFWAAEAQLKSSGFKVWNPARNGNMNLPGHMTLDAMRVASSDLVAVLPGWEKSSGAKLEVAMANYLGIPVYHVASLYPSAPVPAVRVVAEFHLDYENVSDGEVVDKAEWPVINTSRNEFAAEQALRKEEPVLRRIPASQPGGPGAIERAIQLAKDIEETQRRFKPNPLSIPFERAVTVPEKTRFEELLSEMQALHDRKKSDYTAGSADILRNYRMSGDLAQIGVVKAIFARLCEKVIRISSILEKGGDTKVKDESITDTCLDLAIISLLLRIAFEEAPDVVTQEGHAGASPDRRAAGSAPAA